MDLATTAWVFKYAPKTIDDMILSEKNRTYFASLTDIPNNYLFVGPSGAGKTTLAKILARMFAPTSYLFLNASDESGIDVVRTKIKDFISTLSLDGGQKLVILDECLEENTIVWILREGRELQIPIKDLNDRTDLVKSYNFQKDQFEYRPFDKFEKGEQELYQITFDDDTVVFCTIDHKWYVTLDDGSIQRKPLSYIIDNGVDEIISPIDSRISSSTSKYPVLKIKNISKTSRSGKVYDLSVDGTRNFCITDKHIVTSNCDGLSLSAQDALRFLMEEFLDDVKFILTGNHKNKIREAIHSRCITFDFTVDIKAVFSCILYICSQEAISLNLDQKRNIALIVKQFFPDIRKTINQVQKCCLSGEFVPNIIEPESISADIYTQIAEKVEVWDIRKFTLSNENNFGNDYLQLMKNLFALYVEDKNTAAVMYIVDAIYKHAIVADPEINFTGLLINLSK